MSDYFKNLVNKNNKKFLFIAELSANHGGNFKNAIKLIKLAKKNRVDFVKFQTYEKNSMTINSKQKSFSIKGGIWKNMNLWKLYGKAETPYHWQKRLFNFATKQKIKAFSTPFDETGVEILKKLNCKIIKIASLETTDFPLVDKISKLKKPVIFSTGTSNLMEIEMTYNYLKKKGVKDIAILYCVSNYPSNYKDFSFNNIKILKKKFNCVIGFSDHSNNNDVMKSAIAAGAEIIEKHVKLDNNKDTPDKEFSIEINKVKNLIFDLKKIKFMNRNLNKYFLSKNELNNKKFRRSIYVFDTIRKDEKINFLNIKCLRPLKGITPKNYNSLINMKSPKNLKYGEPINEKLYKEILIYNRKN
ncbi:MAG: pseudaminic acid synthase [Candidatus Pelagibacter sp. TMED118]|nr:MAG: pseudaminic acid synthase [Candidatus Pelagibacter sp. TMED118]|tara:strand:+ start:177 stop:1250 length:1074 start_codon:yes stop_codon:yes gene_type:complete